MKYFTSEVKIALVAVLSIVLLFFGMNFLKGVEMFANDVDYYVAFDNTAGLTNSSPVYADGYQVGTVSDVKYDYSRKEKTLVCISVNKELRIPSGSTAEIASDLMGNIQVNLLLANNPREKVNPRDTIVGGLQSGAMAKVGEMLPAVEKMLPKLDSILYSLNVLLADPAIATSLHNIQSISQNLETSTAELNTLMAGLNKQVPQALGKADAVLDNAERLTGNLAAIDVQQTMNDVNLTLSNVKALTARLNSNEGTLGLLMNDPQLYNNLNSTMRNADSLMINLRQQPKRYVHFSLFGKKDK